eukprot:SAG11_NODE_9942_length_867_cov_1.613281_1_plen_87_part_10
MRLDAAGAKRESTLARYSSEVNQWRTFCKQSGYDPTAFSWDAFELFAGWMLEHYKRQNLTSHATALNHYFCQFHAYRGKPPVRAEHG